jgi:hypothetical protein
MLRNPSVDAHIKETIILHNIFMYIEIEASVFFHLHLLKDLESARDNLANKKPVKNVVSKVVEIEYEKSGEEDIVLDGVDDNFDEFTPIVSRKTKKKLKKLSGGKKSNQGVPLCGTKSLRKGSNNHLLCDIITGPRLRSHTTKNSK